MTMFGSFITHIKKEKYMNRSEFNKLVFSELRIVGITTITDALSNENIVKAVTANEEFKKLGYTLSPVDIINLSCSLELSESVNIIRDLVGDVKAKPMYPNFPKQVMEMDEAVFRFHQMIHYMSTYGIESLTCIPVVRGWLPTVEDTEKTESDATLLSAKVFSLVPETRLLSTALVKILSRREHMTDKDIQIVQYILANGVIDDFIGIDIPFKENMMPVFYTVLMSDLSLSKKVSILNDICKHTGDVIKCTDYALVRNRYHFKTSQKRTIVRLLETYGVEDFRENVCLSNRKAERAELIMRYLDFNEYSKDKRFQEVVSDLRSGKLRSWMSRIEQALSDKRKLKVLNLISERPGMALRMVTRLLREKINVLDIFHALEHSADKMSTQSLVSVLNFCDKYFNGELDVTSDEENEKAQLDLVTRGLLSLNLRTKNTPLKDKKVYLDMSDYNLSLSVIETNDKSSEGGYVRSGIAYRIPDSVSVIRFFVYWNDKRRVDIDLHTSIVNGRGDFTYGGWNDNFRSDDFAFSGDITHSDAAEYIDIRLDSSEKHQFADMAPVAAHTSIKLYNASDIGTFKSIDECFVGAMAVSSVAESVNLYNPKNCFFTHYLTSNNVTMYYGYVDIKNRVIITRCKPDTDTYLNKMPIIPGFSLDTYLDMLLTEQGVTKVSNKEDADVILVMGKPSAENEISLIDNNFFMD